MTFLTVNSEKHLLKHLKIKSVTTYCSTLSKSKSPRSFLRGLLCDRQQSILPGRFQPSTFDAWELNCCVRDGNRWGLPAIVTGSERSFCVPASSSLRLACPAYFSKPSRRSLAFPCGLHKNPRSCFQVLSDPQYRTEETTSKKLTCLLCLTSLQIKPSTD